MLSVRNTDQKGRLVLGGDFANRTVLVERVGEDEIIIKLARVIPESEAWLYKNKAALNQVREGLEAARQGRVNRGPNLKSAIRLAKKLSE
jgi:hypothetical protein